MITLETYITEKLHLHQGKHLVGDLQFPATIKLVAAYLRVSSALGFMDEHNLAIECYEGKEVKSSDGSGGRENEYTIKPKNRDELLYFYVGLIKAYQYHHTHDPNYAIEHSRKAMRKHFKNKVVLSYLDDFTDEELKKLLDL